MRQIQYVLVYPTLDDPESSANQDFTLGPLNSQFHLQTALGISSVCSERKTIKEDYLQVKFK